MRRMSIIIGQYLRAFIIIYLCLYAGIAAATLLPFTIPGSIMGMLLLFGLLTGKIIPEKWVKPGSHLLIRYMALLFVPVSVGIIQYYPLLKAQFGPVVVSCFVSTFIVLVVVSLSSHLIHNSPAGAKKQ